MYKYVNQRLRNMFTRIFIYVLNKKPRLDLDDGNFFVFNYFSIVFFFLSTKYTF